MRLGKEFFVRRAGIFCLVLLLFCAGCVYDDDKTGGGTGSSSTIAVVATGGDDESNISVIDYADSVAYNDLLSVSGTCELAQYDGYVYLIDKDGNRIIKFDPVNRIAVAELSTGPGSAPESIAFLSGTKAYVTMSDSASVKVINPSGMTVTKSIDIAFTADADGDPDQGNGVIRNGKLYVALRRSNGSKLTDYSSVVVINTAADTVMTVIQLATNGIAGAGKNPLGGGSGSAVAYASVIGSVSKATDGAVEMLDSTMTASVVMTESQIGGNISNWVFDTPTTGWAIAGLSTTSGGEGWGLKRFDLTAGTFTDVSSFQKSYYCWALDYTDDGLVLVGSSDENNPGVWVFDSRNGYAPVFSGPISTGLLPKRLIVVR